MRRCNKGQRSDISDIAKTCTYTVAEILAVISLAYSFFPKQTWVVVGTTQRLEGLFVTFELYKPETL